MKAITAFFRRVYTRPAGETASSHAISGVMPSPGINLLRSDRPRPSPAIHPGLLQTPFWGTHDPSILCRRCHIGLVVASDLWFWSACSGNVWCPCARAFCWTEQLREPCSAPAEMGHWPITSAAQTSLTMVVGAETASLSGIVFPGDLSRDGRAGTSSGQGASSSSLATSTRAIA